MDSAALSQLLQDRESSDLEAQLRDIFGFVPNAGSYGVTMGNEPGNESSWGNSAPWAFKTNNVTSSTEGGQREDQFTFDPGPMFRSGVMMNPNSPNGEGSGGFNFSVDGSKFPRLPWGDVNSAAPVNPGTDLYNPNMVYHDSNYGDVTPFQNIHPDTLNTIVSSALPAIASAGVGALAAAPQAMALINMLRSYGSSGSFNPMSLLSLLQAIPGMPNLSSLLGSLPTGFGG